MQTKLKFFIILLLVYSSLQAQQNEINTEFMPFSCYGSYLSIMPQIKDGKKDLYILDVSGRRMWTFRGIFKIEAIKGGKVIPFEIKATASNMILTSKSGTIEITYDDCNTLRFRGKGLDMRLTQSVFDGSSNAYPIRTDSLQWRILMGGFPHLVYTQLKGSVKVDARLTIPLAEVDQNLPQSIIHVQAATDGTFEAAFEQYSSAWKYRTYPKTFDVCVAENETNLHNFSSKMFPISQQFSQLSFQASYLKWSSVVTPRGFLKREAILCSKNLMASVWSWDNCFSAMAVCYKNSKLALDQFRLIFDNQSIQGSLPDMINDNHWYWGAVKPPIQGLALKTIMQLSADSVKYADFADLYEPICRFTNFWFDYQDDDHDGIPQYNITNDSGEDNGTVFEAGFPLESPDLCAYLIIQMEFLSDMALNLGRISDSRIWKNRAEELLSKMVKELWNGKKFVARNVISGKYDEKGNSFLNYIPIILGKRLPENIRAKMLLDLKDPKGIVTPYGPASEHPQSPYFIDDGYWRGPVWAPNVFLLVYGLEQCGEFEYSYEIARRYIDNCSKSGFPENFSCIDGRPLRDKGYSWTADVFMLLAMKIKK